MTKKELEKNNQFKKITKKLTLSQDIEFTTWLWDCDKLIQKKLNKTIDVNSQTK
jgi:hypothetical protein